MLRYIKTFKEKAFLIENKHAVQLRDKPMPSNYDFKSNIGFTLAELLISLLILAEIATFTIPKIITAQQNGASNAKAKEVISMISSAYQQYSLANTSIPSNLSVGSLTPYLNYLSIDSSSSLDTFPGASGSYTCGSGTIKCLKLHNGGTLIYDTVDNFSGTGTTNFIYYRFDPDGVLGSTSAADGPSKSLNIIIYYNGRITTFANIIPNSVCNGSTFNPGNYDPSWFSF